MLSELKQSFLIREIKQKVLGANDTNNQMMFLRPGVSLYAEQAICIKVGISKNIELFIIINYSNGKAARNSRQGR